MRCPKPRAAARPRHWLNGPHPARIRITCIVAVGEPFRSFGSMQYPKFVVAYYSLSVLEEAVSEMKPIPLHPSLDLLHLF